MARFDVQYAEMSDVTVTLLVEKNVVMSTFLPPESN
jgi:hypothetical protein